MNIRNSIKTGMAAIALATAPLNAAAQKTASKVAADSVKIEQAVVNQGRSLAEEFEPTVTNKLRLGYVSHNIAGLRIQEPRLTYVVDTKPSNYTYFRPELSVGTQSYSVVLPMGLRAGTKNLSVEAGTDFVGVRGLYGRKALFDKDVNAVMTGERKYASSCSSELYQDLHAGVRYQNDFVNASVRGEVGRVNYLSGSSSHKSSEMNVTDIEATTIPIVKAPSKTYAAVRADLEVTPLNNKDLSINAQGAIATNKSPEFSVGLGYKF